MDDDFAELELLSLVSKVTSELQNHLGISEKTLAEFIIATRLECADFSEFKSKLANLGGASWPESLFDSIDRLVRTMHPKFKAQKESSEEDQPARTFEEKETLFKGLSIPDKEINGGGGDDIDDTLALLEGLESKARSTRPERSSRKRSRSPEREDGADSRHRRKERYRSRDRGDRDYDDDNDYRNGRKERRSRKDERDEYRSHRDGYRERRRKYDDEDDDVLRRAPEPELDDAPVLYKVYDGHVTGIKDFGAFVNLHGVKGKVDGMVHISNLVQGQRDVKVKDVDQETGMDLAPQARIHRNGVAPRNDDNLAALSNYTGPPRSHKKRMTSPERWEIRQLIASGDYNATLRGEGEMELEEEVDIEVREEEPPFLTGQTKQSLELSPIRVVKAPDGSLNQRKELRQQEAEASQEDSKVDLAKFASDLRAAKSTVAKPDVVPEWKRVVAPKDQSFGKRTTMSIKQQRESLPVFAFRNQLIKAVRENQILIVLTQYLAEAGFTNNGMIGCTQPRRVAAMSVAKRVAEEVGCQLGQEVGYTIRFEDCTSPATKIKYMTDGMLEREILMDPDLRRYSVIMLDEAHERTIATDVLFALLKKTVKRRPDLKIIVTSATLDADKFSAYFNECPIFTIPGRTFPVEILYSREPESDYLDAALVTVMQIHLTEPPGDILVFLTGSEEIDTAAEILYERMKALGPGVPELIILPSRIFDPAPPGKTSITIDHIYYVVDPGFVKQNAYDPKLAQANQRAGRAGRTGPGKCFRLYTEAAYQSEMLPTTIPEIQRQNLANTILMLKAMGINDLLHFDFMDPPPTNTMLTALEELYALSALDDEGLLTRLGRKMADFPMEPALAKVLIGAVDMGCSDEMLSIVAMLNLPNIFYRPKEKQTQADQKKAKFHDPHGDHLTLLNVYNAWKHSGYSAPWCFENFIQARSMKRAKDVREQIVKIMQRYRHPITSCGRDTQKVRQALCSGFFRNSARKDPQEGYKTLVEGTPVYLHPSSALFGKQAEWVIYHTLVLTTKEYMHCTTSIEPKWLVSAAPTFFKVAPTDKLSKRKKAERIQPLYNKYAAEDDWRLSAQRKVGRSGGGGGTWG
ncbi:ATP-dependent RNA helicase DHX8 [Hypomontagnella monticulosa]|nr:ATP-dependent RNA helicase DHX8 [Hypomontagnella monticulosa]